MDAILIVCQLRFPEGDAGSVRVCSFAQTLTDMGYLVYVVGMGSRTRGIQRFKGIRYLSLRQSTRYDSYLGFSGRLMNVIQKITQRTTLRAIITSACMFPVSVYLKVYCRKSNVLLINDVQEWYSPSEFKYGRFSPIFQENNLENRTIGKPVRVISISSYLEDYFAKKGIQTVRIPIYFDQNEYDRPKNRIDNVLNLLYAGSPRKKDKLDVIISGLFGLDDDSLRRLRFVIIGVSLEQVQALFPGEEKALARIVPFLEVLGRVPRTVVLDRLQASDFTILLRDSGERYAKAGFPSKVIESISTATPVIMNFTSDLERYFTDGVDCIEVKSYSAFEVTQSLKRALLLSELEINRMSQQARKLALRSFDRDTYRNQFEIILETRNHVNI